MESALAAELKFYAAFEQGDLDLMMVVWANTSDIVCVHPLGTVLVGPSAIRASWAEILAIQVPRKFEIERVQIITTQDLVLHLVYESITLPLHRQRFAPMAATNGYRYLDGGWRMVLHHAGPVGANEPIEFTQSASSTRH